MNLIVILLVVALVVTMIVRRFLGQPVRAQSFVLPLGISVWGLTQLRGVHPGAVDLAFLAVEALLAVAVGLARGTTIQLYLRGGQLWQRYRWSTLAVWIAAILLRLGSVVVGRLAGAHVATQSLTLMLGISFLAEAAVVGWRVARTGAPVAPSRRRTPVGG
jgi:hypothetical protein